ncbi:MAG: hypothetical protein H6Q89_3065 [Myxococcaceae bacterium]|nr:hypothetical protein [Myxococcaceae bacterium]
MKALLSVLLFCGCASFSPVTIARELGSVGWFRADGALKWQPVDPAPACGPLAASVGEGEVIVLVPGVKGDGPEITAMLPLLAKAKPAAMFLYRWVPWDHRDAIAGGFATGLSHLLECLPNADGRLLVLAHSAGGIVVSLGATRVNVPTRARSGPATYLITVASPLAGTNERDPNADGRAEVRFMLDFGTRVRGYPVAPAAIKAVHLRTQYPADTVMKPAGPHLPNDPKIGIPDARQIDLPAGLTHDGSLLYVAQTLSDGTWRTWFENP